MSTIDESQFARMKVEELFHLRRRCAENRDIEGLLSIAKYRFIKGSMATNVNNLPEMCYYYGRLHRVEELKELLQEKSFYLFGMPESCIELAQHLIYLGDKFPYLHEEEISYLETKYCDSKTFELFDIIMFDCELLPRPIKKFDKESLNRNNKDFSKQFLINVYNCFSKNDEMMGGHEDLYVYSRIHNKIIRKEYSELGLGEYCIIQPILSKEFWTLMQELYDDRCADLFLQKLFHDDDWEKYRDSNTYLVNAKEIEGIAKEYFSDLSQVENVKAQVASQWLKKINSKKIILS